MGSGVGYWSHIGQKRILSLLLERRLSYSRHFEIKISEAGPSNMRAEPHIINSELGRLLKQKKIDVYDGSDADPSAKIFIAKDFGSAGDLSRLRAFTDWREMFLKYSQENAYCGMVLERLIFEAVLNNDLYNVVGSGPLYDGSSTLYKPTGAETLHYGGNSVYKSEHGAGFDLFLIHKRTNIPIGIEAKNIRQWIYPASIEVWRMIARACTLNCLPVIASRKISYIATAGFFANFGILGFQTHFQYMSNAVNKQSNYKFKKNVIDKDRLGFADIRLVKEKDGVPQNFNHFFNGILDENIEAYYEKFQKNKKLLQKYAIDLGMAENKLNQNKRYALYKQFKAESLFEDTEVQLPEGIYDFEFN